MRQICFIAGVMLAGVAGVAGGQATSQPSTQPAATQPVGVVVPVPAPKVKVVRLGVRPVPPEASQIDSKRGYRSKYEKDFADVTPAGKRRLAGILLREAGSAAGDAAVYVAMSEARELAVGAGEVDLAIQIAGDVGRKFDVDGDALKAATLHACENVRLSPQQSKALAEAARGMVESRLAADDFDGAARTAQLAEEASRRSGDGGLQSELSLLADFCHEALKQAPKFRAANVALAADPTNAEANQSAGEFLVLVKQEWGRALLLLSRGTNVSLKEAAAAELSNARGAELMKAAEVWMTWAAKKQGPSRKVAERHARWLYEKSAEGLEGADLEKCLGAVGQLVNSAGTNIDLADLRYAEAQLGEARWAWWMSVGVNGFEMRTDAAELKSSQGLLRCRPRGQTSDEFSDPPDDGGAEGRKGRITYELKVLCADEQGHQAVLKSGGKALLGKVDKPIRMTGPSNSEIKRINAGKVLPIGAYVVVKFDGVVVSERVWKVPVKRAWWLDEALVVKK